jgi:cytochrome c-type biogenesis protein CcmF
VHSFASDPLRGLFILGYITLATGGALLLYAMRAPGLAAASQPVRFFSREGFLLLNNLLLTVACATVSLATLYPLAMQALDLGNLSIGPPYYNSTVIPLLVAALLLAGFTPLLPWGGGGLWRRPLPVLFCLVFCAAVIGYFVAWKQALFSAAAMALAVWTAGGGVACWLRGAQLRRIPLHRHGMMLSHLGAGMVVAAVAAASLWSAQQDTLLHGETHLALRGYDFSFAAPQAASGPNYTAQSIKADIQKGNVNIVLFPEVRHYSVRDVYTTEAAIHAGPLHDIYIALGRSLDGKQLSARVYIRPLIAWLWAGVAFMALGGMLAFIDRIHRRIP